jgi:hypothetical protein
MPTRQRLHAISKALGVGHASRPSGERAASAAVRMLVAVGRSVNFLQAAHFSLGISMWMIRDP